MEAGRVPSHPPDSLLLWISQASLELLPAPGTAQSSRRFSGQPQPAAPPSTCGGPPLFSHPCPRFPRTQPLFLRRAEPLPGPVTFPRESPPPVPPKTSDAFQSQSSDSPNSSSVLPSFPRPALPGDPRPQSELRRGNKQEGRGAPAPVFPPDSAAATAASKSWSAF